jgi:hypothetical protein
MEGVLQVGADGQQPVEAEESRPAVAEGRLGVGVHLVGLRLGVRRGEHGAAGRLAQAREDGRQRPAEVRERHDRLAVRVDDGADLGTVLAEQGVHLHFRSRRPAAVHLVAVEGDDGDVLGLEQVVLSRGRGAGEQARLVRDTQADVARGRVDQALSLQFAGVDDDLLAGLLPLQ